MSLRGGIATEKISPRRIFSGNHPAKSVQGRYGIPAQQHPVSQDTPLNLNIKLLQAELLYRS
jgi:hypothetical protein